MGGFLLAAQQRSPVGSLRVQELIHSSADYQHVGKQNIVERERVGPIRDSFMCDIKTH